LPSIWPLASEKVHGFQPAYPDTNSISAIFNSLLRRTTTTTPTITKERSSSENEKSVVGFVFWVPDELRDAALKIVAGLSPVEGQIVIDEWAGCMAAEFIDISPLGYLQAMVRRYREGKLTLVFARDVADIRARPPDDLNGIAEIEICAVDCDED